MKTFRYKDFRDGEWYEARVNGIDSALHAINEKIARNMPVETVETDALKKRISSMNLTFQRDITKEEAATLVKTLKAYFLQEIDKAEKYYVDRSSKIKGKGKGK